MDGDNGVLETNELLEGEGEGLIVDASKEDEGSFVEVLNANVSEDDEGVKIDVEENVGGVVFPWQLPLLIATSSIAKLPR